MTNSFAFVDNFAIDGRSRREIRSHVMRGKNTSKARASKRRDSSARVETFQLGETKKPNKEQEEEEEEEDYVAKGIPMQLILHNTQGSMTSTVLMSHPFRRLENTFSGIAFPVAVDDHLRSLIKQFYVNYGRLSFPAEFCSQQHITDTPWFTFALHDQAYCYAIMAMSVAYWDLTRGRKILSPSYKHYFSKAIAALQQKLSSPDAADTSTIALVTGLCVIATTLGDHGSHKIHVDGLRNIVKHRGGIATLLEDSPLVMEKAQRADIEDAFATGGPATFPIEVVDLQRRIPFPAFEVQEFPSLETIRDMHPGLADAAQETSLLTQYLSILAQGTNKLRPPTFAYHITYTFSKVLALGSIKTSSFANPVADILHLTLSAILGVLTVQFGLPNPRRYEVLLGRLTSAVNSIMSAGPALYSVIDPFLMNWVLHVLPATALRESDHHWLVPKMILVRELLGFETWQEAHAAVRAYPWVANFHDKHIIRLWSDDRRSMSSDDGSSSEDTTMPGYYLRPYGV